METKWKLIKRKGREGYVCRVKLAGKRAWIERATHKTRRRDAESVARKIVAKLEANIDRELTGWAEFRARYQSECLSGAAKNTGDIFRTSANRLEELCKPEQVGDVTADMLSRWAVRLRDQGLSEATIKTYRTQIMAALDWAVTVGILHAKPSPPRLPRVPRGTKSRGRPITREEAERIAAALPKVVGKDQAARWAWNLEALWRSGMRIGETLNLYWDRQHGKHWIGDLDRHRPYIGISAESEKGFRDRTIPMTPDFVAMLREIPSRKRSGAVFHWPLAKGETRSEFTIGRRISEAGKMANVVVNQNRDGSPKYASAHDWRRAFALRWAPKVMPIILKELMRHESIETTMQFYVGLEAATSAEALWSVQACEVGDMLDAMSSTEQLSKAEAEGFEPSIP